jgi:GTP-binding protein
MISSNGRFLVRAVSLLGRLRGLNRRDPNPTRHSAPRALRQLFSSSAATAVEGSDVFPEGAHDPLKIRNLAICAHVDHGKTTLCDKILRACEVALTSSDDRVMDSNDMERERGITIMSKVTTVMHRDALINVVDSPGHGDFGAEVERVLGMVDSTVLLVDATEGPMAQTKFVLSKALALHHRPLVVINKVDRDTARPQEVESEVFDLFASLDASDEQLDFTTLYASARDGWVSLTPTGGRDQGMVPLLDKVIELVPPPKVSLKEPFAFVVTLLSHDTFRGRTATGRVCAGYARVGDTVHVVSRDGQRRSNAKITRIVASRGLQSKEIPVAGAGDIVSLSGINDMSVSDTIGFPPPTASAADCNNLSTPTIKPIWTPAIDPPTVAINFTVNDSPLAGKDGVVLTTQKLTDWLRHEAENNVSIHVADKKSGESLEVKGRGELQLGIVIEKLRRENYELAVSPPRVLTKTGDDGAVLEPLEELMVEVDEEHSGSIIEKLSARQADFLGMKPTLGNRVRLSFLAPSRGLLGYRPIFTQDTRGTGIMNRIFAEWAPPRAGMVISGRKGALISMAEGLTSGFALASLEARGTLFVGAREAVYAGMIIGESSRDMDIDINPVKGKQLTNIRTHSKDEIIRLSPPRVFTLESAISYVSEDELVEVTPKTVRMRKRELDANKRIRNRKRPQ